MGKHRESNFDVFVLEAHRSWIVNLPLVDLSDASIDITSFIEVRNHLPEHILVLALNDLLLLAGVLGMT